MIGDLVSYLGKPGWMVPLRCPESESVSIVDGATFQTTLEGRVKAQSNLYRSREWSVSVLAATPQELGEILAFPHGEWGIGPFVWFSANATVTNLLSPDVSTCGESAVMNAYISVAGPLALGADGFAGRSLTNNTPASRVFFGGHYIPAVQGKKVTASAYLVGAGAQVGIQWYTSAGAFISSNLSVGAGVAGSATRLSVTATPPATAATFRVIAEAASRCARPAATYSDVVLPWTAGNGCYSAVVTDFTTPVVMAEGAPHFTNYANVAFKVTEVE